MTLNNTIIVSGMSVRKITRGKRVKRGNGRVFLSYLVSKSPTYTSLAPAHQIYGASPEVLAFSRSLLVCRIYKTCLPQFAPTSGGNGASAEVLGFFVACLTCPVDTAMPSQKSVAESTACDLPRLAPLRGLRSAASALRPFVAAVEKKMKGLNQ